MNRTLRLARISTLALLLYSPLVPANGILVAASALAAPDSQGAPSCARDNICNVSTCRRDPDCVANHPKRKDKSQSRERTGRVDAMNAPTGLSQELPREYVYQLFGGAVLTEVRARAIVERAGYDYISFSKCAPASDDCALFSVQEKRPPRRPLFFVVTDSTKDCLVRSNKAVITPLVPTRARMKSTAQTVTDSKPLPFSGTVSNEDATPCFGTYPVLVRGVFNGETTFTPDPYGSWFTTRMSITYQTIDGEKWRNEYTLTNGSVYQPWAGSGWEEIWYYEVKDQYGVGIAGNSESTQAIASSGGSGPSETLSQRCTRVAAKALDLMQQSQKIVSQECQNLPEISLLSSINFGMCPNHELLLGVVQNALAEAIADSCEAAPGCFFTGNGPCSPNSFMLLNLSPYYFEWMTSGSTGTLLDTGNGISCSNKRITEKDLGGGCKQTTTEECDEIHGLCSCKETDSITTCVVGP